MIYDFPVYKINCVLEIREVDYRPEKEKDKDKSKSRTAIRVMHFLQSIGIMPEHLVDRAINNLCWTPYHDTKRMTLMVSDEIREDYFNSFEFRNRLEQFMRDLSIRLSKEKPF